MASYQAVNGVHDFIFYWVFIATEALLTSFQYLRCFSILQRSAKLLQPRTKSKSLSYLTTFTVKTIDYKQLVVISIYILVYLYGLSSYYYKYWFCEQWTSPIKITKPLAYAVDWQCSCAVKDVKSMSYFTFFLAFKKTIHVQRGLEIRNIHAKNPMTIYYCVQP